MLEVVTQRELPLVVLPRHPEPEQIDWACQVRCCAQRYLSRLGCILFRGFGVVGAPRLRRFATAFGQPLLPEGSAEEDGAEGRFVDGQVAGRGWPLWRWLQGGSVGASGTLSRLSDGREVFRHIPKRLRARFMDRGLLYARDFPGLGESTWGAGATVTNLELWWRARGWRCEWQPSGGLRIWQRAVAALPHPITGDVVWFNRAHCCAASSATAQRFRAASPESAPCRVWYADGAPIEEGVLEELRAVFTDLVVSLPWEEGDVLMLDNLVMSHAAPSGAPAPAVLFAQPCFTLPAASARWRQGLAMTGDEAGEAALGHPVPGAGPC